MSRPSGHGTLQGYQKKPLAIGIISLIFFVIPGVVLAQMCVQSGGSLPVLRQLVGSRYFLQEWVLSWSAAAAVYVVSRWSFAYFVGLSGYVLFTRTAHLISHPILETPASLLITAVWLSTATYFFASSLRAPYLNPKLRWWTRPPRIAHRCDARITLRGVAIPATVLNLSRGGAFLRVEEPVLDATVLPQRLGERLEFAVNLASGDQPDPTTLRLATTAELVWRGKPDSPYRNGFGIRFTSLPREQQRQLRRYLRDATRR